MTQIIGIPLRQYIHATCFFVHTRGGAPGILLSSKPNTFYLSQFQGLLRTALIDTPDVTPSPLQVH